MKAFAKKQKLRAKNKIKEIRKFTNFKKYVFQEQTSIYVSFKCVNKFNKIKKQKFMIIFKLTKDYLYSQALLRIKTITSTIHKKIIQKEDFISLILLLFSIMKNFQDWLDCQLYSSHLKNLNKIREDALCLKASKTNRRALKTASNTKNISFLDYSEHRNLQKSRYFNAKA